MLSLEQVNRVFSMQSYYYEADGVYLRCNVEPEECVTSPPLYFVLFNSFLFSFSFFFFLLEQ